MVLGLVGFVVLGFVFVLLLLVFVLGLILVLLVFFLLILFLVVLVFLVGFLEKRVEFVAEFRPVGGVGIEGGTGGNGGEGIVDGARGDGLLAGLQALAPGDGFPGELGPVAAGALRCGGEAGDDGGEGGRGIGRRSFGFWGFEFRGFGGGIGAGELGGERRGEGGQENEAKESGCGGGGGRSEGRWHGRARRAEDAGFGADGELAPETDDQAKEGGGEGPLVALDEADGIFLHKFSFLAGFNGRLDE